MALLVSFFALVSSIAIPFYLLSQDKREKLKIEKRNFHQFALSVKSIILSTKIEATKLYKFSDVEEETKELFKALQRFDDNVDELINKSENANCIKCFGGINGMYKCLATIEAGITDSLKLIVYIIEQSNKSPS